MMQTHTWKKSVRLYHVSLSLYTYHDLQVDLASHSPLLPPRPAESGVECIAVLPLWMDVELFVLFHVLGVPDAGLRRNLSHSQHRGYA